MIKMSEGKTDGPSSSEQYFERTLDQAVTAAVVEAIGPTRRQVLLGLGAATLSALVAEVFPLGTVKSVCGGSCRQAGKDGCQHRHSSRSPAARRSSWPSHWVFIKSTG